MFDRMVFGPITTKLQLSKELRKGKIGKRILYFQCTKLTNCWIKGLQSPSLMRITSSTFGTQRILSLSRFRYIFDRISRHKKEKEENQILQNMIKRSIFCQKRPFSIDSVYFRPMELDQSPTNVFCWILILEMLYWWT